MATSAPRPRVADADDPPIDPRAVERAFVHHRAKRAARLEHHREQRRARWRFWLLLGALFILAVLLAVTIWEQIRATFGL